MTRYTSLDEIVGGVSVAKVGPDIITQFQEFAAKMVRPESIQRLVDPDQRFGSVSLRTPRACHEPLEPLARLKLVPLPQEGLGSGRPTHFDQEFGAPLEVEKLWSDQRLMEDEGLGMEAGCVGTRKAGCLEIDLSPRKTIAVGLQAS
ncbi:hypothetical protein [Bradyrhizobium uaiense]|uniref:Uncharacterized protein n=1 Tax=Bradyrhizobium uaiense TaxID=2594946 RepID=A0A6P1BVD3_9BRAD|nr:hypothetical protein [Bradyrhizobium uaiense]NEV02144.1 hypothetical protein [Bradyrhizobium uaiense]